jgi:hypothetical protein
MPGRYDWMARDPNRIGPPPMRVSGLIIKVYVIGGVAILVILAALCYLAMMYGSGA